MYNLIRLIRKLFGELKRLEKRCAGCADEVAQHIQDLYEVLLRVYQ